MNTNGKEKRLENTLFFFKMLRMFYENGYHYELCSSDTLSVEFCKGPASQHNWEEISSFLYQRPGTPLGALQASEPRTARPERHGLSVAFLVIRIWASLVIRCCQIPSFSNILRCWGSSWKVLPVFVTLIQTADEREFCCGQV